MLYHQPSRRRGAALAVEAAFVYPVLLLLLLGLIVGGVAVFRYQQVVCLAQEAARWASVRGGDYQKDTGRTSPTRQDIVNQAVMPLTAGMDPGRLRVRVQWVDATSGRAYDWDSAGKAPAAASTRGTPVTNRVRVTVTYQSLGPVVFVGPLDLTSTAEEPMSF
jgi:Flp pilus assembly protein TadG